MSPKQKGTLPVISFFSGCGAFDLGFLSAGFNIGLAVDSDAVAVKTYNHNHSRGSEICKVADLAKLKGPDVIRLWEENNHEMPLGVIGGSPCQTFSNSNVHFLENDARHTLPRKYARILKSLNSHYELDFFVFENVKGITSARHRQEYTIIKRLFKSAGFVLFEGELDAANFGVAQHRERVFLVGLNTNKYSHLKFMFPDAKTKSPLTVQAVLENLPEPLLFKRGTIKEQIPYHPNHWAMFPKSRRFYDGSLTSNSKHGRSFRVLKGNKPSWTVAYGNREVHIHPKCHRRLSVYEAMLLQGLPKKSKEFELLGTLSDQIRQVSDAIPPQIGKAIAVSIKETLY